MIYVTGKKLNYSEIKSLFEKNKEKIDSIENKKGKEIFGIKEKQFIKMIKPIYK